MTIRQISGRFVLAGGSGFLGISLAHHLAAAGASVVILSRRPPKVDGPWKHVAWDARSLGQWQSELEGRGRPREPGRPQRQLHQDARQPGRNSPLAQWKRLAYWARR